MANLSYILQNGRRPLARVASFASRSAQQWLQPEADSTGSLDRPYESGKSLIFVILPASSNSKALSITIF